MKTESETVVVDNREIKITNPGKTLFPSGVTKGELIKYYSDVSELMLPHIRDRPLTMERYPDGIDGEKFFQKNIPAHFPSWVRRVRVASKEKTTTYVVCNDRPTLVYLANLACVPMHVWMSRVGSLDKPDKMIFDLDPGEKTTWAYLTDAAEGLRYVLKKVGLKPFIMSTGSRGAHVTIPLDGKAGYEDVRAFAVKVAQFLAEKDPTNITLEQRIEKRKGRLFIDTYRNSPTQTAAAPYSVRPRDEAPIAVPIEWKELKTFYPGKYHIRNINKRLFRKNDPWKDFWTKENRGSVKETVVRLNKMLR